ncbi:TKL protein kinase [Sporothrix schenckii ATCC 58251]|uniref:EKC/KEOPS complex subunit BUD32 n=1 Tax=Sporothrix schenckii (strain ATCC 58251 / de Perez 2211183) TaxID=1391915 RepID=U7PIN8_SPOS1|nr:TKL protein kinase [Sporothrix schenckii ATCC 58251]
MPYKLLGLGATCYVTKTDNKTVLKGYQCEDDLVREATIYRHLGSHPQILECFGLEEQCPGVHSLRLELAPLGCVRQFIAEHADAPLPRQTRIGMALDVAQGVAYLHAQDVQYCDLSCRNVFLFDGYRVKLGDFGASLLAGYDFKPTFSEEAQYELPLRGRNFKDWPPTKRDLFALGSAIYEITMWKRPFQGLSDEEVESSHAGETFPSLEGNMAGPIIQRGWDEEFDRADEVAEALARLVAMGAVEPDADDDRLQRRGVHVPQARGWPT